LGGIDDMKLRNLSCNRKNGILSIFITVLSAIAIFAQPMYGLISSQIAYASGSPITITPSAHSVDGSISLASHANASGFDNLHLSFDHEASNLESGDKLTFGWRLVDHEDQQLGVIEGQTNVGGLPGAGENGSKSIDLPASASSNILEIYFANSGGTNDTVSISNIKLTGTPFSLDSTPATLSTTLPALLTACQAPVDFTVSTTANDDVGRIVRGKSTVTSGNSSNIDLKYLENAGPHAGSYVPLTFTSDTTYFGPSSGFPLGNITSSFKIKFNTSGTYIFRTELIDSSDDSTVGTPLFTTVTVTDCAVKNISTGESFTSLQLANDDSNTVDGNTIEINSDLVTTSQTNISKRLTIDGKFHTIYPSFSKTSNSNNSALTIFADNVRLNQLTIDGKDGTNLHGINTYEAQDLQIWRVTLKNNDRSGLNVNRSWVQGVDLHTINNGWYGINVDKPGAYYQSAGIPKHDEAPIIPAIYVDNRSVGQVNDTNGYYSYIDNYIRNGDRAYFLKTNFPQKPTNFGFTLDENDTSNSLTCGHATKLQPLLGTGSIAGQKYIWSHWDKAPNTSYHIETFYKELDGTWTRMHNSNNSKPTPYRFYGYGSYGDGIYRIKVVAYSTQNMFLHSDAANCSLTFDTTKPHVSGSSAPYFNPSSFTITANEVPSPNGFGGSGIQRVVGNIYKFDQTNENYLLYRGNSSETNNPYTINLSDLPDGRYYVKYNASDKAGNISNTEKFYFVVDRTAPAPPTDLKRVLSDNSIVPCGGTIKPQTLTPRWTKSISDDVAYYEYSSFNAPNGTPGIVKRNIGYTDWFNSRGWISPNDGTARFELRAVDEAGNKSDVASCTVIYDSVAPKAPIIETPSDEQFFSSTPIPNSWSDVTEDTNNNPEVVDHYQVAYAYDDEHTFNGSTCPGLSIDGTYISGCRDVNGTSRNHTPVSWEQGGVKIWVRAIDKAGNIGEWSSPVHYYYDSVAPNKPTLLSPANNSVVNGASITQSWQDESTDIDYFIYESYHDASANNLRWHGLFTDTTKTAINVGEANYWWRVKAVDKAGNESDWSDLWKITVDNTAPVVNAGEDQETVGSNITLNGAIGDATSSSWAQVSGPGTASFDNPNSPNSNVSVDNFGTYVFQLSASDSVGNSSTDSVEIIFNEPMTLGVNTTNDSDTNEPNTSRDNGQNSESNVLAQTSTGQPGSNGNTGSASQGGTNHQQDDDSANADSKKSKDNKDTDVKSAVVASENSSSPISPIKRCTKLLGICWYWWIPIVIIIAVLTRWIIVQARKSSDNTGN